MHAGEVDGSSLLQSLLPAGTGKLLQCNSRAAGDASVDKGLPQRPWVRDSEAVPSRLNDAEKFPASVPLRSSPAAAAATAGQPRGILRHTVAADGTFAMPAPTRPPAAALRDPPCQPCLALLSSMAVRYSQLKEAAASPSSAPVPVSTAVLETLHRSVSLSSLVRGDCPSFLCTGAGSAGDAHSRPVHGSASASEACAAPPLRPLQAPHPWPAFGAPTVVDPLLAPLDDCAFARFVEVTGFGLTRPMTLLGGSPTLTGLHPLVTSGDCDAAIRDALTRRWPRRGRTLHPHQRLQLSRERAHVVQGGDAGAYADPASAAVAHAAFRAGLSKRPDKSALTTTTGSGDRLADGGVSHKRPRPSKRVSFDPALAVDGDDDRVWYGAGASVPPTMPSTQATRGTDVDAAPSASASRPAVAAPSRGAATIPQVMLSVIGDNTAAVGGPAMVAVVDARVDGHAVNVKHTAPPARFPLAAIPHANCPPTVDRSGSPGIVAEVRLGGSSMECVAQTEGGGGGGGLHDVGDSVPGSGARGGNGELPKFNLKSVGVATPGVDDGKSYTWRDGCRFCSYKSNCKGNVERHGKAPVCATLLVVCSVRFQLSTARPSWRSAVASAPVVAERRQCCVPC